MVAIGTLYICVFFLQIEIGEMGTFERKWGPMGTGKKPYRNLWNQLFHSFTTTSWHLPFFSTRGPSLVYISPTYKQEVLCQLSRYKDAIASNPSPPTRPLADIAEGGNSALGRPQQSTASPLGNIHYLRTIRVPE